MQILQQVHQTFGEIIHDSNLLDLIAQWPDWKLQALCLDESDLKIKETIQNYRKIKQGQINS